MLTKVLTFAMGAAFETNAADVLGDGEIMPPLPMET